MSEDNAAVMQAMFGVKSGTGSVALGSLGRESRQVKYWKKPDGWVTTGPTRQTDGPEYLRYLENKQYKPLPDSYGVEVVGKPASQGGSMMNSNGHTRLLKFIDAGGIDAVDETGEFGKPGEYLLPREQLIVMGMHRKPDIVAKRPDLVGIVDVECPYGCIDQATSKPRLFAYQEWCDQHVVAVHKDAIASEAVGRTIAKAMEKQSGGADTTQIAAIVAAVMAAMNPVQTAAVAAVAVENDLVEYEEDVEVDGVVGENIVAPTSTTPSQPPFDIDNARRPDMMAFAKTMGFKTLPLSANADAWRVYLKEQLAS